MEEMASISTERTVSIVLISAQISFNFQILIWFFRVTVVSYNRKENGEIKIGFRNI